MKTRNLRFVPRSAKRAGGPTGALPRAAASSMSRGSIIATAPSEGTASAAVTQKIAIGDIA